MSKPKVKGTLLVLFDAKSERVYSYRIDCHAVVLEKLRKMVHCLLKPATHALVDLSIASKQSTGNRWSERLRVASR